MLTTCAIMAFHTCSVFITAGLKVKLIKVEVKTNTFIHALMLTSNLKTMKVSLHFAAF